MSFYFLPYFPVDQKQSLTGVLKFLGILVVPSGVYC